jgi:hypothetical protein
MSFIIVVKVYIRINFIYFENKLLIYLNDFYFLFSYCNIDLLKYGDKKDSTGLKKFIVHGGQINRNNQTKIIADDYALAMAA